MKTECLEVEGFQSVCKNSFYNQAIERILGHLFPSQFFESEKEFPLLHRLPLISWTSFSEPPFDLSFFLCAPFRPHSFRFFYEMISRWLIPGKRLNVPLEFAAIFEYGGQKFICGEVTLRVFSEKEIQILQKNLPIMKTEIRIGLESSYRANRILETKGIALDEKTSYIQENLISLIKQRPQDFDYDILEDVSEFLILCKDEFKAVRTAKHMSRIICIHYLFHKALNLSLEIYPDRRYISIKLIRAHLSTKKKVLGIVLAISFIQDFEIFEERHILSGIKALIPEARMTAGSYFIKRAQKDPIISAYLEIEKESENLFTLEEEKRLKEQLPTELKGRIETRLNPIFMHQNEEEIVRHILSLSEQLKFSKDLPQVVIDFSHQTEESLEFLVILLRAIKDTSFAISEIFAQSATVLEFFPDRTKIVGSIRKNYRKEASVFRLRIRKSPFFRKDHSVDLYKARQKIVCELAQVIGEFRDYNGGIISRETEVFESLRKHFGKEHTFLLENFFYALNPPLMRSVLPKEPLRKLFLMLLNAENEGLGVDQFFHIHIEENATYFFLILIAKDSSFYDPLSFSLKTCEKQLVSFFIKNSETPSFGIISEKDHGREIRFTIEQVMTEWSEKKFETTLKYSL